MVNANKRKGDWAEKVATLYAKTFGFDARRTKAGYERDYGDIHLIPFTKNGFIIQVKNVVTPQWNEWFKGLDLQKEEASADYGFILNKRPGQGEAKVGEWLAVMRYKDMLELLADLDAYRSATVEFEEEDTRMLKVLEEEEE